MKYPNSAAGTSQVSSLILLGLAMVGLLVVRIFGEEKPLARDLEGY
jgi:hypothetical protein